MAEESQLPVIASVRAAWTFFVQNWRRFLPVAAVAALGQFVLLEGFGAGRSGLAYLGYLTWMIAEIFYQASIYRFALRGEFPRPFGLRVSADEGRIFAVGVLMTLFLILVFLAAFIPAVVIVSGIGAAGGDPTVLGAPGSTPEQMWAALGAAGRTAAVVAGAAVAALMLFVGVRLCLAAPATIAEERIVLLKSWPWTKGCFLRLLAAIVIAMLPSMAATYFFGLIATAAAQSGAAPLAFAANYAASLGATLIGGMMTGGLLAFLYQGLRPRV